MSVMRITSILNKALTGQLQKRGVSYGQSTNATLDIYGQPGKTLKPVVMFWHGGSWKSGSSAAYQFMADYIERLGAIPVIVGYPLYPEQTFPGFIDDADAAVEWVSKNIQHYGGDPQRVYAMGHSAGGHTAVLVTLQDKSNRLAGCISFAAPMNLSRRYWESVFGAKTFDKGHQNPINHIGATQQHRFLLLHGTNDRIVRYRDSKALYRRLQDAGYSVELITLRMGHFRILTTMIRPIAYRYRVGKRVKAFISQ